MELIQEFERLSIDRKLRAIDLFAGTGAMSVALESIGIEIVYANDFDESASKAYQLNFPDHHFEHKDLHNVDISSIPDHDILCAGFPCQPFSIAGKQQGFEDTRANVFWKILEIITEKKPRVIILENVKNLKSHDKGNTFARICDSLCKMYHLHNKILDTAKLTGIPHHRERIYIFGFIKKEDYEKFSFDLPIVQPNNISEYLQTNTPAEKYYYNERFVIFDSLRDCTLHVNQNVVYQYRRYYVRQNKSGLCPTLTANMGQGGHNVPLIVDDKGIRKLTPRECFNLQGFPSSYLLPEISDSKLYKLAGNAITMPIVQKLGKKIKAILTGH